MSRKTAIVTICPDCSQQVCIQTNGVDLLRLLDGLKGAMVTISSMLVEEAKKHVGDNPDQIARWIDLQRQKPDQN